MTNLPTRFSFIFFYIIAILSAFPSTAQVARFDYIKGSNDFVFPATAMDTVMEGGNCNAFFYGETHTRYFEPMFKLHYITYLHERYKVKNVFMEMGYSAALLFDTYLSTGDTSLLRIHVLYTSPHYMDMWRQLYAYNRVLPEAERIHIHGVDFEATSSLFIAILLLRDAGQTIPPALSPIFSKIETYVNDTSIHYGKDYFSKVKEIKKAFAHHRKAIAQLYGSHLLLVNKILDNDIKIGDKHRDEKIYKHMLRDIAEGDIKKFVAFYGGYHVNYQSRGAVANLFKANKDFTGHMQTTRMFCFDAYDNWSHEVLDCIGADDDAQGQQLKQRYMDADYRAILITDTTIQDDILQHSADYYLFAADKGL